MRIKRFIESLDENSDSIELKNLLVDFYDRTDFEIKMTISNNFIILNGYSSKIEVEKIEFFRLIDSLISSVKSLGYKVLDNYTEIIIKSGRFELGLQFVDELSQEIKVPDINSFSEFKKFISATLGLIFYEFDSELYIPDNLTNGEDLLIEISDNGEYFIISGPSSDINWGILSSETKSFLEPLIISDDEYYANMNYNENGEKIRGLKKILDEDGNEVSKEKIKLLQKSYKEKLFKFDKSGAELIIKIYNLMKSKKKGHYLYAQN